MNTKVLTTLEYTKVIELLAREATSSAGEALCRELLPGDHLFRIRQDQKETADAFARILKRGNLSFSGIVNIDESARRLEVGSAVSCAELIRIADLLEVASRAKTYGKKEHDEEPNDSLSSFFASLEALPSLYKELRRCILAEDEIADDASPELARIRRQFALTEGKIHTTLNGMVNGSYRSYLQDPVITMRDNRYCLPVKAEFKSHVSGIVHDQSSSGATLFIEPIAIVNIGNELKDLAIEEAREIEVILRRLSLMCAEHLVELKQNFETLRLLDFIFAKGRLAVNMRGMMPTYNEDHYLKIRNGRHPLLDRDTVVPISIELGGDFHQLIVTGPNTGGKTVSLKTVGLFCLMGQAGLHVPADDGTTLPLLADIYADIGDEQSIEQSLSTFSSHMTNIVSFLRKVDENCLVLFDELCSGTDPVEGAALAMAILTRLHDHRILTMATTHYSELKVYALTTPDVCNASCEFNVETLQPTYRILMGIPGKSNAFAISKKLGLDEDIIEDARARMDEQDESLEDLLTELETSRVSIEREKSEIEKYRRELAELKEEARTASEKMERERQRVLAEARQEADSILSDAKSYADETIRSFRKFGKAGIDESHMERERERLRKKIKDGRSKLGENLTPTERGNHTADEFHLGDRVHVISMNADGTVLALPDERGLIQVQMGILKSKVPITDVKILADDGISGPGISKNRAGRKAFAKSLGIQTEINLLGKTVDEAVGELEKYLDNAYLAHLTEVRIVHGKGTGALRKGVQQYLKRNKHVKSFRLGGLGEGDTGVTIAELKS